MPTTFTIGCDPELAVKKNGRYVPAYDYFVSNSSFGLDGYDATAELRPGYSESPIDLTAKIKIVLEYGHEKHPDLEFFAGHYVEPLNLGGHLHFGLEPNDLIISNLDTVLYSLSNCIDDLEQRKKREHSGYGKRCSYRKQPHGFEFRQPGSWLLCPSVTLVNFTLAKLAVIAAVDDNLDLKAIKSTQKSKTFLKELINIISSVSTDCEEGLKQMDQLLNKQLNWNQNILPLWGIN